MRFSAGNGIVAPMKPRRSHRPLDLTLVPFTLAAVIRFRVFLAAALALAAIIASFVNAQLTDEEKKKRDARAKAREEMRAIASPTPAETPEPKAKPKPAKRKKKSSKKPTPKPKATVTPAARK